MKRNGLFKLVAAVAALGLCLGVQAAAPDVTTVATASNTLFETVGAIAVAILTFTVGARLIRKFVK